jgi:hypothetical protein
LAEISFNDVNSAHLKIQLNSQNLPCEQPPELQCHFFILFVSFASVSNLNQQETSQIKITQRMLHISGMTPTERPPVRTTRAKAQLGNP